MSSSSSSWILPIDAAIQKTEWIDYRVSCLFGMLEYLEQQQQQQETEIAEDLAIVVRLVEELVYTHHYKSNMDYKTKMMQLAYNLRQNPTLTTRFPPDILIQLTDLAMASPEIAARTQQLKSEIEQEVKAERAAEEFFDTTENDDDDDDDASSASQKNAFLQCRACKSKRVLFEQKQTRSADEAMTVFCQCMDCGKRWRM